MPISFTFHIFGYTVIIQGKKRQPPPRTVTVAAEHKPKITVHRCHRLPAAPFFYSHYTTTPALSGCGGRDKETAMRLLFEIDKKDYGKCTRSFVRDSARSIIISGGRVAMVRSARYGYYKFPGGGIEDGENPVDAMIRETREESGLIVLPETVREYGYVHRIQRSGTDETECFIQDNYYYFCKTADEAVSQELDDYEAEESYTLEFVEPNAAIRKNRHAALSPFEQVMLEREARVLELMTAEGLFDGE